MRFRCYRKPAAVFLGVAVGTALVLGEEHSEHIEVQQFVQVPALTYTISTNTATGTYSQSFSVNGWQPL
jgi:hypothetical protein